MKSLSFMIVGAQKAGTTALAHFLSQHPEIQMSSKKEVHLFDAPDYDSSWSVADLNQQYAEYFDNESCIWGEATPIYLYWTDILPELKRYNPNLRVIVVLRDPVERAVSHYNMEFARGLEKKPLWLALILEPLRLAIKRSKSAGSKWRVCSYRDRGLYSKQLESLRRCFSDDQILVLENQQLRNQHTGVLKQVFKFLNVDPSVEIAQEEVFAGGGRRPSRWLVKVLKLSLFFERRRLQRILCSMGVSHDWNWL